MGIETIHPNLTAGQWEKDAGKKAPPAPVKTAMDNFAKDHKAVDWSAADAAGKAKTPDEIKAAKAAIDAAMAQLAKAGKSAEALKAAAKAAEKEAGNAAKKAQDAASGYLNEGKKLFESALKKLEAASVVAAKAATKTAPAAKGAAPMSKADEQMLMKFSKKAIQMSMKPRPGAKPMQFAIVGKPGPAIKVLMGSKTEIAKLIAKFGKVDPATKKKPFVAKDPASQLIWENGALIFQSARIPASYVGSVKKALVKQIKKSPKVKWRKPGAADVDDGDNTSDALSDADLHVEEDAKELERENAAAQAPYKKLLETLSTNPATKQGSVKSDMAEAAQLAGKGQWADALAMLEEIELDLDASEVEEEPEEEEVQAATPAAKSSGAPAAKSTGPDLGGLAKQWSNTRDKALAEIKGLAGEIVKLYPNGDPNLRAAIEKLDKCMDELKKPVDKALEAAGKAKSESDRKKAADAAKAAVERMLDYVKSDEIMQNLDDNEVKKISARRSLQSGLEAIDRALQ